MSGIFHKVKAPLGLRLEQRRRLESRGRNLYEWGPAYEVLIEGTSCSALVFDVVEGANENIQVRGIALVFYSCQINIMNF